MQSVHESIKLSQVDRGDSLWSRALLFLLFATIIFLWRSRLTWMVPPQEQQQLVGALFQAINNSVIDGIFVLLKPCSDIVRHSASIVNDGKVSILISFGLRFGKWCRLAQMLSLQLVFKGLVSRLGEESFLLKNSPDAHGFLKHDDASLQIHSKIYHGPINTFRDVFLLFNNKHVVVEELLQFLIDKVDGNLFIAIVFKDLKASNIQDSAKVDFFHGFVN